VSRQRRRATYSSTGVSYAAVGATQAADVMIFPPQGLTPHEEEYRLGSGEERFSVATEALMTWAVPLNSHLDITSIDEENSEAYRGVMYNEFGVAMAPTEESLEQLFASDGTPFLSAGTTVQIFGAWTPTNTVTAHRVIYVVRENRRMGYALGTLDDGPVTGEEYFGVEWREDDSVWSVYRSITAVGSRGTLRALTPLIRIRQWMLRRQYIRALLPNRMV
jgi:uncharacterized protein (UPF0548 family)